MSDFDSALRIELERQDALRDPATYIESFGWKLYRGQRFILESPEVPTLVVSTRQYGKTLTFGGLSYYVAQKFPRSYSAIVCPDENKSKKLIQRLADVALTDKTFPGFRPDNSELKGLPNASTIEALPGSIKGVVGGTAKLLVYDEAGLSPRSLFEAASPMQAHVDEPWRFMCSSAWYQDGLFYDEWDHGTAYRKVIIRARFDIVDGKIVDALENEKHFADRMMAERGAFGFYSEDYPTAEFLQAELETYGERMVRQQYLCEFLPLEDAAFSPEMVARAWAEGGGRRFGGDGGVVMVEGGGRKIE